MTSCKAAENALTLDAEPASRGQMPTFWAFDLPGIKAAASTARKCALACLAGAFGDDHRHAYDRHAHAVELVVSELFTNAVLHSTSGQGGRVKVELDIGPGDTVKITVIDQGRRATAHVPTDPYDEYGKGLLIIEALAEFGAEPTPDGGRRTWALIA